MNTKSRILASIQQQPQTILNLCELLSLTRTAVNLPIKQLLAEELIRGRTESSAGQVGKPSMIYEAAAGTEDLNSKAYLPILQALIGQIQMDLGDDVLLELLKKTGRQMARATMGKKAESTQDNIEAAMKVVDALGATTQLHPQADGGFIITNNTCPAATVARANGQICQMMSAFFAEATGIETHEFCQRDERLVCRYRITP